MFTSLHSLRKETFTHDPDSFCFAYRIKYSETSIKRTPSGPSQCPLNRECPLNKGCKNCAMFVKDQHSTVTLHCDKVACC